MIRTEGYLCTRRHRHSCTVYQVPRVVPSVCDYEYDRGFRPREVVRRMGVAPSRRVYIPTHSEGDAESIIAEPTATRSWFFAPLGV